ncbi:hypothetical protein OCU04_000457 [Sclerotinia nivalis]|uniref:Uncharacterized protein n=1 Tax=Sclerotinia nivalis TaxID=352851 RepID=A0A9X0AWN3_9HELO|nr:hypothetical protein OCU04_000457 [Sclerotinia nivalis]
MATSPIFTAADAKILRKSNHLKPAYERRLQASILIMKSELPPSLGNSNDSGSAILDYTIIPEFLISKETLLYIGWTAERAKRIWKSGLQVQERRRRERTVSRISFLEHALGHINISEVEKSPKDWMMHLQRWGVTTVLIDAIMDPEYADVRLTESAQYWVRETIELRYMELQKLRRDSAWRDEQRRDPVSNAEVDLSAVTATKKTTSATHAPPPGYRHLYKAIPKEWIVFDTDGSAHISHFMPLNSSDFSRITRRSKCLTPDLEVAKLYESYIRRRSPLSASIIQYTVPDSMIERLQHVVPFGDIRKETVYASRSRQWLKESLAEVCKYPLIIAPIAKATNEAITWQHISNENVLHIKDRQAQQYLFQTNAAINELEGCEAKVVTNMMDEKLRTKKCIFILRSPY